MTIRDGDWELMEWDPVTGRTVWLTRDERGRPVIRTDTPVQSTLDENATVRNATPDGWKGDWHRVASVPMQLLYDDNLGLNKAIQQGDDKYLSRFLNDPDNRAWRTKEGRV
jgi:YD repeat-containing protein